MTPESGYGGKFYRPQPESLDILECSHLAEN